MNKTMKTTAVMLLALFAATACTRRVQVESEPNRPDYDRSSSVAPAGVEDASVGLRATPRS